MTDRKVSSPSAPILFCDALDVPSWGRLWLIGSASGLAFVRWGAVGEVLPPKEAGFRLEKRPDYFLGWKRALGDYFGGRVSSFDAPLLPVVGTPFQRRVWEVLRTIGYGDVQSYRWVAERAGAPGGARAVGSACGANPLPIVVPCHRVVCQDGRLGGYTGGLPIKIRLLEREGVQVGNNRIMEAQNAGNV